MISYIKFIIQSITQKNYYAIYYIPEDKIVRGYSRPEIYTSEDHAKKELNSKCYDNHPDYEVRKVKIFQC